jgi:hypothetical protein
VREYLHPSPHPAGRVRGKGQVRVVRADRHFEVIQQAFANPKLAAKAAIGSGRVRNLKR